MTPLGHAILIGWIPAVLVLFAVLPPRRAVLAGFIAAWLFLPNYGYAIAGLPNYTKMSAAAFGALAGAFLFDRLRPLRFRPAWIDLPMGVWCVVPFFSSVTNGLGVYDGLSESLANIITWGLPWLLGRIYLGSLPGQLDAARAIVLGAAVYVPLCLFEVRMSPQLHRWLYGFHQEAFHTTMRFGGFRPMVFMQHGLQVGVWLGAATLIGIWCWSRGLLGRIPARVAGLRIDLRWALLAVVPTFVLAKSLGAIVLVAGGLAALFTARWTRSPLPVLAIAVAIAVYMPLRAGGFWDGRELVSAASVVSEGRSKSLAFRLENEDILAEKAMRQPVFGWGGWGRARVYNERGYDTSITDGLWIIALGQNGVVGLTALFGSMLIPPAVVLLRAPPRRWRRPALAAPVAVSVVVLLYAADCLPNGMVNPVFMLLAGGLGTLALRPIRVPVRRLHRRRRRAAAPLPAPRPAPPEAPALRPA